LMGIPTCSIAVLKKQSVNFLRAFRESPSDALSSALATAYHQLAFQTLANQVRHSVRAVRGNQWRMFRMGHPADYPLRLDQRLRVTRPRFGISHFARSNTMSRMDLTHSGWSDIFLGDGFPGWCASAQHLCRSSSARP
jgi:hypothetical protein